MFANWFLVAGEGSVAVVTTDMLEPLVSGLTANIGVILPIGMTILAMMVGISLIPRIIYKFL